MLGKVATCLNLVANQAALADAFPDEKPADHLKQKKVRIDTGTYNKNPQHQCLISDMAKQNLSTHRTGTWYRYLINCKSKTN